MDRLRLYDSINDEYLILVAKNIIDIVTEQSNKDTKKLKRDYYTPHGAEHFISTENIVIELINKSGLNSGDPRLSNIEVFLLFVSIWIHDIGMFDEVAEKYFYEYSIDVKNEFYKRKRDIHENISGYYMRSKEFDFAKVFEAEGKNISSNDIDNIIHTVSIIIKYHRRRHNIIDCPKIRFMRGQEIRLDLIACLLRIGDTLQIDSGRFDKEKYSILRFVGDFDRGQRLHWLKSYVISSIHLNIKKQTVYVTVDLPDVFSESVDDREKLQLAENAKRLRFMIEEEIYDDLLVVGNVLTAYGVPFYTMVDVLINYTNGFEKNIANELRNILNDLDIIMSPNTSKVINKALESLTSMAKLSSPSGNKEYKEEFNQLIRYLESTYNNRPCHLGLKKVIEDAKSALMSMDQVMDSSKYAQEVEEKMFKLKEKIEYSRKEAKQTINERARSVLESIKYIFLFGYSQMVTDFLDSYNEKGFKETAKLYIFECSIKTRFSVTNNIEYNDGIHYAINMRDKGYKNIYILPDAAFASLIEELKEEAESSLTDSNSLLLFGANGVGELRGKKYPNGVICLGHSSGHLTMAIIAGYYNIPIKVIVDDIKMGKYNESKRGYREKNEWLTMQKIIKSELNQKNIKLLNFREDRVPLLLEWKNKDKETYEIGLISNKNYDDVMKEREDKDIIKIL